MKIFTQDAGWDSKVNFVDENNVLLGYDLGQCCCENADWFISDTVKVNKLEGIPLDELATKIKDGVYSMDGWVFDNEYFKEVEDYSLFDEGKMVIFRIVKDDQTRFIHLFNCHNGYYGHGFEFVVGGNKKNGYL